MTASAAPPQAGAGSHRSAGRSLFTTDGAALLHRDGLDAVGVRAASSSLRDIRPRSPEPEAAPDDGPCDRSARGRTTRPAHQRPDPGCRAARARRDGWRGRCRSRRLRRDPGDIGASCLYAVYDPVSGTCTLSRAGHPSPILVCPNGTTQVVDVPAGPPLGLGSLPFEAAEPSSPEGSLLALFTDGLIETRGHDIDDRIDELRDALARSAPSLEELCDTVLESLDSETRTDDIALLVARTRTPGKEHVAEWDVTPDAAAVAETRKLVDERLTGWGLEEATFTLEPVVSELVTNAIRYGSGPIRLRLIKERSLICEVSDSGGTAPHLRRARVSEEGGRGLFLVAGLTQRWGTHYTSAGKTIWAEQALGRSPRTAPSV
ncbi:ATP-binding SpoIIE family protein phosphatase [Streptomyces sp. NPDC097610]|uniref:ATP-binding SpoIIE family protein phosphatase n=1 Tax=Streptomyces sp. NPDC097610 TaxID=3157227 RepID=UPI0033296D58